jgi:hypothetical protein
MPKQLQHFVPRFYLRRFVDPKHDMVWTYAAGEDAPKLLPVDVIAARNNYYTAELATGKTNALEELFSTVESRAAPVVEKLIDSGANSLSDQERGIFSEFLSFGCLRIPKFRNEVEGAWQGVLNEFSLRLANDDDFFAKAAKRMEDATGKPITDREGIRHSILSGRVRPVVRPEASLRGMMELVVFLAHRTANMIWTVRESDRNVELVTSDNPVILHNVTMFGDRTPDAGALEVVFPLSPSHLFLASWDGHVGEGPLWPALARQMNKLLALAADKYVYSSTRIPAMAKYLKAPRKRMLDFEKLRTRIFAQE